MATTNEIVTPDWTVEAARFEKEIFGLVRALAFRAYKKTRRPRAYWNSMAEDACIFAWRAWRSLRLRGLDPQDVGAYAIADRAVLSTLQGARFQPVGRMGDRSWADSVHNRRNGVKVKNNKEVWQLEGSTSGGHEDSDLMSDWGTWKSTLADDDRMTVRALEAGDTEAVKAIKGLKAKKRKLADRFREYRQG